MLSYCLAGKEYLVILVSINQNLYDFNNRVIIYDINSTAKRFIPLGNFEGKARESSQLRVAIHQNRFLYHASFMSENNFSLWRFDLTKVFTNEVIYQQNFNYCLSKASRPNIFAINNNNKARLGVYSCIFSLTPRDGSHDCNMLALNNPYSTSTMDCLIVVVDD